MRLIIGKNYPNRVHGSCSLRHTRNNAWYALCIGERHGHAQGSSKIGAPLIQQNK